MLQECLQTFIRILSPLPDSLFGNTHYLNGLPCEGAWERVGILLPTYTLPNMWTSLPRDACNALFWTAFSHQVKMELFTGGPSADISSATLPVWYLCVCFFLYWGGGIFNVFDCWLYAVCEPPWADIFIKIINQTNVEITVSLPELCKMASTSGVMLEVASPGWLKHSYLGLSE